MSKFKYQGRSAETVAARSKQSGGNYDSYLNSNMNFLKVKEGNNDLRILPPTWDVKGPFGDNWGLEVFIHRDIGPDKGAYLCLDKMREKYGPNKDWPDSTAVPEKLGACPLCEARHDVPDDDEAALKALKPGKQILCYVINRDDEKSGPLVWRLGWQLERDIQLRSQDKKTGAVIKIDHHERGYDISFTREGAGLKTKYVGVDIAREASVLHDNEAKEEKWLDFITNNPLNEQLVFFDAAYLEQVYMGKKGGKGADEEEDDTRPTRSSRKPREEEDAEEEQPRARRKPADETEEDEPAPRRRRAVAEEEEEEEPRPRAGKVEEDEEDDRLPTDAEMKRNSAKTRKPAEDEEEDAPLPRRRRPADEEEDAPSPRRAADQRRRDAIIEEEDEPAPRRRRPDPEEEDEPPARGRATDRAKAGLERLKPKGR